MAEEQERTEIRDRCQLTIFFSALTLGPQGGERGSGYSLKRGD
jgi:hypothetical protein